MIGRLTGKVIEKNPDGTIILDVSGVGFEVNVPISHLKLIKESPEITSLFIHFIVREDSIILYGFPTKAHLLVFRLLLQVKNIGPKLASAILSEMQPEDVAAALHRQDISKFKKISGIGEKTAQLIMVELRDKIKRMQLPKATEITAPRGKLSEAASALIHLGFKPQEVQKVITELNDLDEKALSFEEIIKEALSRLTK